LGDAVTNPSEKLLRFDQYMERCLYHPETGFYSVAVGRAGRRGGDFITSAEVGPLFGEVVAAKVKAESEARGHSPLTVIDVGSGPGMLVTSMRRALSAYENVRVVGVDVAPPQDGDPPVVVPYEALMESDWDGALVVANELLDNLPFRIFEAAEASQWREVYVDVSDPENPREVLDSAGPAATLDVSDEEIAPGDRVPVVERAAHWVTATLERGVSTIVAFDYGTASTRELAGRGGWLRTYRSHQRSDNPYHQPGRWDITTDIPFDQLPAPAELVNQAEWLRSWGIDELVAEGRHYWQQHAATPTVAALKMRSRISEADALTDLAGLGGWQAATWRA